MACLDRWGVLPDFTVSRPKPHICLSRIFQNQRMQKTFCNTGASSRAASTGAQQYYGPYISLLEWQRAWPPLERLYLPGTVRKPRISFKQPFLLEPVCHPEFDAQSTACSARCGDAARPSEGRLGLPSNVDQRCTQPRRFLWRGRDPLCSGPLAALHQSTYPVWPVAPM